LSTAAATTGTSTLYSENKTVCKRNNFRQAPAKIFQIVQKKIHYLTNLDHDIIFSHTKILKTLDTFLKI
jgi:hypothetical protein